MPNSITDFLVGQRVRCGDRFAKVAECPHGNRYYNMYAEHSRVPYDVLRPVASDYRVDHTPCCTRGDVGGAVCTHSNVYCGYCPDCNQWIS